MGGGITWGGLDKTRVSGAEGGAKRSCAGEETGGMRGKKLSPFVATLSEGKNKRTSIEVRGKSTNGGREGSEKTS